ncbi:transmembrane protein 205-like isoform X3 [Dreissena polymorpha]|uniref:transmembrane protein 205-like isoform X3 n=1 Tax=Dreissena polymorpha TaxID=45954 RepID=UPI0022648A7F|nr:transmembrane protein 205-like isoform X3 [Dreissena polymorpha]
MCITCANLRANGERTQKREVLDSKLIKSEYLSETDFANEQNKNEKEDKHGQTVCTWTCSRLVRYFSVLFVAAMVTYMMAAEDKDADNVSLVLVHLLSVAAHFGTQCWVTFVAGITMFVTLPRDMFGRLQSRLSPLYFATSLFLSILTFVTFWLRHPYETMTSAESTQFVLLCVCVGSSFVNSFFLVPQIVSLMIHLFELEKASGVASVVGYCDRKELKKDLVYSRHYKTFRISHSVAGLGNLANLVCNAIHLYYLARSYVDLQTHVVCDV